MTRQAALLPAGGYRTALSIKERLLGHTHPEIAILCHNLGTLLRDRRRGHQEN
jgi:hypothetical protein